MNYLTLPIVHPAFEHLKRYTRLTHLIAGIFLLAHAWSHYENATAGNFYSWCLAIMAIDIFILVFAGHQLLQFMPTINAAFRLIESLSFLVIAGKLFYTTEWSLALTHSLLAIAYAYLWYCEKRSAQHEQLHIMHSGVVIGGLNTDTHFKWSQLKEISAGYDQVKISTADNRTISFKLRQNLQFEELDQIHEFCRYYLKTSI